MRVAFGCGPPSWRARCCRGRPAAGSRRRRRALPSVTRSDHSIYLVVHARAHGQSDAVDAAVRCPAQRGRRAAQLGQELVSAFQASPVEMPRRARSDRSAPRRDSPPRDPRPWPGTPAGSARARLPTMKNVAFAARRRKIRSTSGVHCLVGPSSMVRATNRADGAVRNVTAAVYAAGPAGLAGGSEHARACPCSGGSPVSICGTPARSSLRTGHPGMSRTRSTTSRAAASTATRPECTPPPGGSAHGSPAGWHSPAVPRSAPRRQVLAGQAARRARGTQTPGPGPPPA